ncbi:multiple monosaccharide ABC transporter permease [Jonesia denitrificans]|uniref:Xylose transport system permease protein XylH n=1 Tax=Jonesia denitrificans (strain ATCC 14870 / DSM 20603 / BCRC 15368 / CIP 55.134 / JCM 11481 / NBRC 15587 / NCTC 10816 / Prevot 55134) TaxID=471856 RepID=C7R0A9_JONDD|nr:multiple monosaccharide ABC transporter permease [Jonesia denitrificans]ACV08168.1 Monosaccharide-transporting ATPase [Jonesia denitrificans DSM 20603]ASE08158.1 ABC transporter permease [Jonesia denitrificans]QXB42760.1 sugar ABC transporter permease [Jonesia denitrificans]SQH20149.1 Xylose transport system permease protein xylH [Jonesia denitrificans]
MTETKGLVALVTRNLRQSGIYIAFAAIIVLFTIMTDGVLLNPNNLTNLVLQYSYILILAIGMVMVIIAGHIDLSVGSVVALAGAVAAVLIQQQGWSWWSAIIAALVVGIIVGVWQGFWVAFVGIPAFIVTLAGMLLFRGLTLLILDNISISIYDEGYKQVAGGFLNGLIGGQGFDAFTLLVFAIGVVGFAAMQWRARAARVAYQQDVEGMPAFIGKIVAVAVLVMAFAWQLATARGLPIVLILLALLIMIYTLITKRTVFGRHIYAIGGNLAAAQLSGVKVKWVNFMIFVNMGFLSALAGVVFSSRSSSAQPAAGTMFELDAIAACFIGGAAVTGGIGTVIGAMVGGLIMAVMSNGMSILGVDQSVQQVVKGLILLLAVAFDVYNKRRAGTR